MPETMPILLGSAASFLLLQHYGGDGVCKFNDRKGSTRVSGGELAEIITYFFKKWRVFVQNVASVA
jgi:hypothetical protein